MRNLCETNSAVFCLQLTFTCLVCVSKVISITKNAVGNTKISSVTYA